MRRAIGSMLRHLTYFLLLWAALRLADLIVETLPRRLATAPLETLAGLAGLAALFFAVEYVIERGKD